MKLNTILWQRVGKVIAVLSLLIVANYLWSGNSLVNSWEAKRNYLLHDSESQQHFEKNSTGNKEDIYAYWDFHTNQTKTFTSYQEYVENESHLFFDEGGLALTPGIKNTKGTQRFWTESAHLLIFVSFMVGFLLFFVDLKTNFNTFLFSLGIKRRTIFWRKILFTGVPLFLAILLGKLLMLVIMVQGIPQPYMNGDISSLLLSAFTSTCVMFSLYSAGVFLGTILGNLVTAPILIWLFYLATSFIQYGFSNFLGIIGGEALATRFESFYQNITNEYLDITPTTLGNLLLIIGGCALVLWLGSWLYAHTSLENNGKTVVVPQIRLPFYLVSALYVGLLNGLQSFSYYGGGQHSDSLSQLFLKTVVALLISFGLLGILFYYQDLTRLWSERKAARLSRLS